MSDRCHCRPDCLTEVYPTDPTVTAATGGAALLEHAHRLPSGDNAPTPAWPGPSPIGVRRDGPNFTTGKDTA